MCWIGLDDHERNGNAIGKKRNVMEIILMKEQCWNETHSEVDD